MARYATYLRAGGVMRPRYGWPRYRKTAADNNVTIFLLLLLGGPATCGISWLALLLWPFFAAGEQVATERSPANLSSAVDERRRIAQRERVMKGIANRPQWAKEQAARNRATYLATLNRA